MIKLNTQKKRGRSFLSRIVPKVLTCLAMVCMFGFNVNAQTYLSESFEGAWYLNGNIATPGTAAGPNAPLGWNQIRVVGTGNPSNLCGTGNASVDWGTMTYSGTTYSSSSIGFTGCAYGNNSQPTTAPIAGSKVLWFYEYWALTGSTRLLATPTVDLSAATTPVVSFSLVNASGAVLRIMGSLDGGTTWNDLGAVPNTTGGTWATRIVSIPAAYKIATARFGIQVVSAYSSGDVSIDNFQIKEGIAPAAPITFATNTVTGNSFNVTWVDNSTNETAFRVYRSTDNVNFTLVNTTTSTTGAATGGSYTLAQTGLSPGTTYYYQITSVFEAESAPLTGSQALAAGTTYTWNQTVSGAYGTATNWTPTRTTPSTSDILIFDGAVTPTVTVTGVTTQSIGQLIVTNSAQVNLSATAAATITMIGGPGKDLDIQAGSLLQTTGAFGVSFAFTGTGNQGNIAGTFDLATSVASTLSFTNSIDTVTSTGILRASGGAAKTFTAGTALLYVAGTYQHNYTTPSGAIPTATWLTGSTVLVSGYTTATSGPTGLAQTFYNFTWNCPNQTANLNLSSASTTNVANEFRVTSTGTGQCRWTATSTYTLNVKDFIQTGGIFDMASGASGASASINVTGTFNQTGGSFLSSGTVTSNPTLHFRGDGTTTQTVNFANQPTGPITYRISNPNGITLTGPSANFALGNGTLGGLRISTKAATPITFAGSTTALAYNAANSTLTYDSTGSYSMEAVAFPATNGPARLTVAVGATNTISMPFSRSLAQTTANSILTMTSGNIDLGTSGSTLTLGASAAFPGTLTWTNGAFTAGSTFNRWWPTTLATGAIITASSTTANAGSAGFYPFTTGTQVRSLFLRQNTASTTGGSIAVKFNNAAGTSVVSYLDSVYAIERESNASWDVTASGITGTSDYTMAISAQGIYLAANGNSRIVKTGVGAAGSHQAGSVYINAQRKTIPLANLSGTYRLGISSLDLPNTSVAAGAWEDPATWSTGAVPLCSDSVVVMHAVDINATGNVAKSIAIIAGGTLNSLSGSDLTVSNCTPGVNTSIFSIDGGTYNNSGGDLVVNGRFVLSSNSAGQFIQSAGNITVDGNSGTLATSAVGHSVDMYCFTTSTLQLTGGNFTVVDPCATSTATDMSFKVFPSAGLAHGTGPNWNLKLGNGLSNDAGGNATAGFGINLSNTVTFRINGTLTVDMLGGTNRFVSTTGNLGINNLNIISGDFRTNFGVYIKGDIVNNGTMTNLSTLYLADINGSTQSASTLAQTISGTGTFRNNATTSTGSFTSLNMENSNASGVTLATPITVSSTFTLTAGRLNTDATNILRIGSIVGSPTAGSLTYTTNIGNYVNGPLERVFVANRTAAQTYTNTTLFPVGYGDTLRSFFVDPSTSALGPIVVRVTPSSSISGTNGGGVSNLATMGWNAAIVSGSTNFTGTYVSLGNYAADLDSTKKMVYSATPNGTYEGTPGGSVFIASTPKVLRSALIPAATYLENFTFANLVPCTAPIDQGTLSSSMITATTFTGTITAAASLPTAYLIVRYPAGSVTTNPVDGVTYLVGGTLGLGTTLGSATTTTSFDFAGTGLVASTSYDYYAYAFNNSGCAGPTYNTITPAFMNVTTCAATTGTPGLPANTAATTSGFTATWTASATAGVDYVIDLATNSTFTNYVPGFQKLNVGSALTYNFTGLTSGATYFVRVWAKVADCWSAMPAASSVQLPCNSAAFAPYSESFETGVPGQLPPCWSIATASATAVTFGSGSANMNHMITAGGTYNRFARTGTSYINYYYTASGSNKYFVAPPIDLVAGTSYRPSIYYVTDGLGGWTSLRLVYSTTPFTNPGTIDSTKTTIATVTNPTNSTYSLLQGDFVAPTTGTYYIAIALLHTGGPWYLSLDDYNFDVTPPCAGMPSGGTISSSIPSSCGNANTTTLTSTPFSYTSLVGISYQWQSSTDSFVTSVNDMVGKTNPVSAVSDPKSVGMNYYRLRVICTNSSDTAYSNIVTSSYTNPQLVSTAGDTRCGTGTTTLSATANPGDIISWYAAATGGAPIGTGSTFTTPSIATTTNYYASANAGGVNQAIIPGNSWNQYTTAGSFQTTAITGAAMILTVTSPITLTSIDMYPSAAVGTPFTIEARLGSGTGTLAGSATGVTTVQNVTTPSIAQTVNLGFSLAPGVYHIGFTSTAGFTNPFTWRSGVVTHPVSSWEIPGVCALAYSLTPSYQYYFYNPIVLTGCEGTRTAVAATITTPPALTLDSTATSICNGSASTTINVTSNLADYATYKWTPALGVSDTNGTSVTFNPTANTTYTLTATNPGAASCATTATLPVTVKTIPVVSASVTNASICEGSSTTLNAAGGATSPYCIPTVSSGGVTDDYLENFTFGSISNLASGDAPSDYTDYSATMSTNLVADGTTTHPFTFDFGGTTYLQTLRIFIDYNQNGTFETTESVFNTTTATTGGTGSITVPNTALNGSTRMRVLTKYNSASLDTESCALSGYGEYEDYNVVISGGTAAGTYAWNPGSLAGASQTVTPLATTVYTVTATSGNGCTASATQNVTVKLPTAATVNQTICTSALPYTWNGQSLTAAGVYTDTRAGSNGCDSVTTLNLTVNQSATSTTNTTICSTALPYSWNGQTLTAAGTFTSIQTAANGCDSIASLVLTVNQAATASVSETICASALPYSWNGQSLTASGVYTNTTTGANGCDSVTTLNLTVNQATSSTANETICSSALPYSWNGQSLTASGVYTNTTTGANGCDSTATLNLTVNQTVSTSENQSICASALPYSWNGQSLTASGVYTNTATGSNGCDSTATLNLTVNQATTATENVTICDNLLPYSWNGQSLTAAGVYTDTQTGSNGCDSTTTLNLTVNATSTGSETLSGPAPFSWNGSSYTASGIYTYTTSNAAGCDSVVTLNLTISAPSTATLNVTTFIQGYYNGTGMTAARYDNLIAAGSATPGNATDVDFVTVELHDAINTATVAYTADGILQTDGTLSVTFPSTAVGNDYYVVLKHQSSLQLWSANPVTIASTTSYNFSSALTQAYTDGSADPMVMLATGVYGMYSGDINQDGFIDVSDYPLFEADADNSAYNGLYNLASDLNGDTFVDVTDYPIFDLNNSLGIYAQMP